MGNKTAKMRWAKISSLFLSLLGVGKGEGVRV